MECQKCGPAHFILHLSDMNVQERNAERIEEIMNIFKIIKDECIEYL